MASDIYVRPNGDVLATVPMLGWMWRKAQAIKGCVDSYRQYRLHDMRRTIPSRHVPDAGPVWHVRPEPSEEGWGDTVLTLRRIFAPTVGQLHVSIGVDRILVDVCRTIGGEEVQWLGRDVSIRQDWVEYWPPRHDPELGGASDAYPPKDETWPPLFAISADYWRDCGESEKAQQREWMEQEYCKTL